jgi:hypothetical protein
MDFLVREIDNDTRGWIMCVVSGIGTLMLVWLLAVLCRANTA